MNDRHRTRNRVYHERLKSLYRKHADYCQPVITGCSFKQFDQMVQYHLLKEKKHTSLKNVCTGKGLTYNTMHVDDFAFQSCTSPSL